MYPNFYNPDNKDKVYPIPHEAILSAARANRANCEPVSKDQSRRLLLGIDWQLDFVHPEYALPVAGAVEDAQRFTEFIYNNINTITKILMTMDTHLQWQIFHPVFWINARGEHPVPGVTIITEEDIDKGLWKANPQACYAIWNHNKDDEYLQKYVLHYVQTLEAQEKQNLVIWPHHCLLGSPGHALVPNILEAIEYHGHLRNSQARFETKGVNALTEYYGAFAAECLHDHNGGKFMHPNTDLFEEIMGYDEIIIGGEASSHCLATTVYQMLDMGADADKITILSDCTSPVVIDGVADFTAQEEAAFLDFTNAGIHIRKSTDTGWL